MPKFGFKENNLNETNLDLLNSNERQKALFQTEKDFKKRVANDPNPTDDEKRMGVYKEFIEPQIRDAVLALVKKGYKTIDSGYDGFKYKEGVQYVGFEKGMIDSSLLPIVDKVLEGKMIKANIEYSQRDFFELTPEKFLNIEEWKKIWDEVAEVFPDRGVTLPFREKFIDRRGH